MCIIFPKQELLSCTYKGGSRHKTWCMARVLNFLIRYFSNYYTLHRSDLAARAPPLDLLLTYFCTFPSQWNWCISNKIIFHDILDIIFPDRKAFCFLKKKNIIKLFSYCFLKILMLLRYYFYTSDNPKRKDKTIKFFSFDVFVTAFLLTLFVE